MDSRLTGIEKRLDAVEGNGGSAAATAPTAPQPANAVPGWRVTVFPLVNSGGHSDTPLARVHAPIGTTLFNLHLANGPNSNQVAYQGSAFFRAKVPGRYTFNISYDQSKAGRFKCYTDMKVEDTQIISQERFPSEDPANFSGGLELQDGTYKLTYEIACKGALYKNETQLDERDIQRYQQISYNVTVLAPDDDQMRPFEPDELFIVKK